ncbi:MAG: penicillin-binding transpeptidase domain-containing protein [Lachnospiraceae bacterium]|nr:penicillin-binding transpeptidase domain-containing protein [Lachnospiraceae bacterium]
MSKPTPVRAERKSAKKKKIKFNQTMRRKLAGLFAAVVLALICLLVRIVWIGAVEGDRYKKLVLAKTQSQYTTQTLAYKRGNIIDRNGTVLAASEKRYHVILDCKAVNSSSSYINPTVAALTACFDVSEEKVRNLLMADETKSSSYQILLRDISIEDKQKFTAYKSGENEALSDDERKSRGYIRGVWFEEHYTRQYPLGDLAGEVLGFVYSDNHANWGIEGYYNNTLSGTDGRRYSYWNSEAEIEQTIVDAVDGCSLTTTLDSNIQKVCEDVIKQFESVYKNGPFSSTEAARNIGVVIMDPNTGGILAMASNKNYDPANPFDETIRRYYPAEQAEAIINASETEDNGRKKEILSQIWRNFCISDTYEPGSVFKPVTVAGALENAAAADGDTFVCDGSETVVGVKIKCANTEGHGEETLLEVIQNSCNDAIMQIGSKLGVDAFCRTQQNFGFGQRTGIDMSGEAAGIVRAADTMGSVELATSSFGQGFNCTMVQEIAAISSIVNGGNYYQPHVVSQITAPNGSVQQTLDGILVRQTVASDVAAYVKSYMKASVDSGTSQYAKVDGYSMGGKTGTSQKVPRGNGKYLDSFIGFAPYDNPQVVIYVVVDEPNVAEQADNRYPQWIARDILRDVLPYLGIYPDEASNPDNQYLKKDFNNPTGDEVLTTAWETESQTEAAEDTDTYYYDDEGDRRNSAGHMVDQEGYLINSDQLYVDENDNVIDASQKIKAGQKVASGENKKNIGSANADTTADTNVPEPQGTENASNTSGGNTKETEGYTNKEAGLE